VVVLEVIRDQAGERVGIRRREGARRIGIPAHKSEKVEFDPGGLDLANMQARPIHPLRVAAAAAPVHHPDLQTVPAGDRRDFPRERCDGGSIRTVMGGAGVQPRISPVEIQIEECESGVPVALRKATVQAA
jgi:hypothetical protein